MDGIAPPHCGVNERADVLLCCYSGMRARPFPAALSWTRRSAVSILQSGILIQAKAPITFLNVIGILAQPTSLLVGRQRHQGRFAHRTWPGRNQNTVPRADHGRTILTRTAGRHGHAVCSEQRIWLCGARVSSVRCVGASDAIGEGRAVPGSRQCRHSHRHYLAARVIKSCARIHAVHGNTRRCTHDSAGMRRMRVGMLTEGRHNVRDRARRS